MIRGNKRREKRLRKKRRQRAQNPNRQKAKRDPRGKTRRQTKLRWEYKSKKNPNSNDQTTGDGGELASTTTH